MKRKIYNSYVKSAMLYGSKTWCLRENTVAILRRAERFMRTMCSIKLVDKKNTEDLMDMLGLKEVADKLAKVNGMRWYCQVLRQPEEDILIKAMVHEVQGDSAKCAQILFLVLCICISSIINFQLLTFQFLII